MADIGWKKKSNRGLGNAQCTTCGNKMRVQIVMFRRSGKVTCCACGGYMEPVPATHRRMIEESDSAAIAHEIHKEKTED